MYGGVRADAAHAGLPARAARPAAARVEAQTRDDHEDVAVVGEDRHPLAAALVAPAHEAGGVQRRRQEARTGQRERDRSGAVVAVVLPGAVAAAPLVGLTGDLVAGGDHRLDLTGGVARGDRVAVRQQLGARAGDAGPGGAELLLELGQL